MQRLLHPGQEILEFRMDLEDYLRANEPERAGGSETEFHLLYTKQEAGIPAKLLIEIRICGCGVQPVYDMYDDCLLV